MDKKVKVLSGGKKSRLALARMIVSPANLLLMDEPTNHLDMSSQELLQKALKQYDGTIIIVSHNRYFLNLLTQKTLELRNGQASVFPGNISEYLDGTQKLRPNKQQNKEQVGDEKNARNKTKEARRKQAKLIQERGRLLTPLKRQHSELEDRIEAMERRRSEIEQAMADSNLYADTDTFLQLTDELRHSMRGWKQNIWNGRHCKFSI